MWLITLLVLGRAGYAGAPEGEPAIVEPFAEPLAPSGPRAIRPDGSVAFEVHVRNEMSRRLRLVEARVALDGTEVVHQMGGPRGRELERSFSALETPLRPGDHTLRATLVFERRSRGPDGEPELDRSSVQASFPFALAAGLTTSAIRVVAREKTGVKLPLLQRIVVEVTPGEGSGVTPLPAADREPK